MNIDQTKQTKEIEALEQPSRAYANYVLSVLFIVYVFNFIDRQLLSVFIGPIKEEFGASDTVMGLLVGFAFALLYSVAGIPIARWADRGNRRSIIAIGLALWSAMTLATGLAKNLSHLVLARIGVGIGEAAGTPPAHSLIADYFPPERRATALAIYSAGLYVGAALAYLGGGYLREYFDWRTAFIVLGIPGLLFALVVRYTIKEPPRGYSDGVLDDSQRANFTDTLGHLMRCHSWIWLIIGASIMAITGYGVLMWGFEFMGRVHGMNPIEAGRWMALIIGGGGALGTYLSGRLTDRWINRAPGKAISVPALATLMGVPFGLVFLLSDMQWLAMTCFFLFYVLLNMYIPMMYSVNQSLAKLNMRATATAIILFITNLLGAGAGPFIVGLLSDLFAPNYGDLSIRYALAVTVLGLIFSYGCFVMSSKHFERDLNQVRANTTSTAY